MPNYALEKHVFFCAVCKECYPVKIFEKHTKSRQHVKELADYNRVNARSQNEAFGFGLKLKRHK